MRSLTKRQQAYVQLRLSGEAAEVAARKVGYRFPAVTGCKLDKNPRVLAALRSVGTGSAVTVVKNFSTIVATQKIPLVEPLSREEMQSYLSSLVREPQLTDQVRILACKLLADLLGFNNPTQQSASISLNIGTVEKNL